MGEIFVYTVQVARSILMWNLFFEFISSSSTVYILGIEASSTRKFPTTPSIGFFELSDVDMKCFKDLKGRERNLPACLETFLILRIVASSWITIVLKLFTAMLYTF